MSERQPNLGLLMLRKIFSVGTIWIVGWTACTLFFDSVPLWNAYRQIAALRYASVAGVITRSEVQVDHGEDGPTYRPDITYTYTVDGVAYAGDRYRYGMMSTNDNNAERV